MFTIDDILQIAFFQVIYIVLFIYLTGKELGRRPKTSLFWLIVAADMLYAVALIWLIHTISTYLVKSATANFRWYVLLFSIITPGLLMLLAFTVYNVRRDLVNKIQHGKK